MAIKKINPYINFNGTAEEAIHLYERALGAKVEDLRRYSEMPGMDIPPEHQNLVMHALLRVGGGELMLSDTTPDRATRTDGNVQIMLDFTDVEEMAKSFDALSAEGRVVLPLHDAFWGAKFGILTDRYQVQWLFHSEQSGAKA